MEVQRGCQPEGPVSAADADDFGTAGGADAESEPDADADTAAQEGGNADAGDVNGRSDDDAAADAGTDAGPP